MDSFECVSASGYFEFGHDLITPLQIFSITCLANVFMCSVFSSVLRCEACRIKEVLLNEGKLAESGLWSGLILHDSILLSFKC